MSGVSYSLAFFLGVLSQTFLVGLFLPLLVIAGYAQWKKVSNGRKVNLVIVFTTAFFGLTITAHWILGVHTILRAALYLPPGVTADEYLQPPYSIEEIIRRAIFQFQVVVGDLIMIYRLYHIYEGKLLICVIPSISTAGLFAIGFGLTNQLRHLETPADLRMSANWSTACFSVNLFNCGFMCVAICIRLWKVHRETVVSDVIMTDSVILRARRVLVESAALWTLCNLMGFIFFLAKSNVRYTFLAITSPVVGICFCMIIVRLGSHSPQVREDSWSSSQRTRDSRAVSGSCSRLSTLPVSLSHVKVDREVYVSESDKSAVVELHAFKSSETPSGKRSPVD